MDDIKRIVYERAVVAMRDLQAEAFGQPNTLDVRNNTNGGPTTILLVLTSPERMVMARGKNGDPAVGIGIGVHELPMFIRDLFEVAGLSEKEVRDTECTECERLRKELRVVAEKAVDGALSEIDRQCGGTHTRQLLREARRAGIEAATFHSQCETPESNIAPIDNLLDVLTKITTTANEIIQAQHEHEQALLGGDFAKACTASGKEDQARDLLINTLTDQDVFETLCAALDLNRKP